MSNDPAEIRNEIEQTRASLSQHVDELADEANPARMAERQLSKVKAAGSRLLDRVMGAAEDARDATAEGMQHLGDTVTDQAGQVGEAIGRAPTTMRRQAVGNPLAAGLVAFGIGLLLAAAFPASRREQELAEAVKQKAEPLTDQVVAAAREVASNLAEPAEQAVDSLKATAGEAVDHLRAEGQGAVEDVRQVASDSAEDVGESVRTAAEDARRPVEGAPGAGEEQRRPY